MPVMCWRLTGDPHFLLKRIPRTSIPDPERAGKTVEQQRSMGLQVTGPCTRGKIEQPSCHRRGENRKKQSSPRSQQTTDDEQFPVL
ncbi:hypothetical protein C0Q70_00187 [Pomacea canaliculata]|uniref:Uncharacterized protein n=1 Tax=Pomacea canaliculata TaxID=400727 RepID=A0A2T7PVZ4_POMCA|nr:hypothetical protein C0Q70_00187 [Pomacea canaliculata]